MGSLGYQSLSTSSGASQSQEVLSGEAILYGHVSVRSRRFLFFLLNLFTFGLPALLCRWNPILRVKLTLLPAPLKEADWVILSFPSEDPKESENFACPVLSIPGRELPNEYTSQRLKRLTHQDSKTHLFEDEGGGGGTGSGPRVHRFFLFRQRKFYWDERQDAFVELDGLGNVPIAKFSEEFDRGVSEEKRAQLLRVFGPNWIQVEVKSYFSLFIEEVLNPFYVFQLFSVILWCFDHYIYYATCVILISLISITISLYETKRQAKMLQEMAQSSDLSSLTVLFPTGERRQVASRDLVPGDVILIPPEGFIIPCDAVLTCGSCIVNESMLTGESVPVQKTAVGPGKGGPEEDQLYSPESHRRHTLFCGTQVIQTRYYPGEEVRCVVVRTGFSTTKGELIHSILYPKEVGFKFYSDAMRFVGILFLLAGIGMSFCIYLYIQRGTSWYYSVVRVLDIVTIVVPPALPAAMTVGTVYAQNRLKKKKIFCISPPRINFCGKLKLICFDKTGTLTEDGLDLWCVVPVTEGPVFGEAVGNPEEELDLGSPLLRALASCHSLTYISGQMVGDPLDIKMFQGTGWVLEEPKPNEDTSKFDLLAPTVVKRGSMEIGIMREFEFTPQLQRMSVAVRVIDQEVGTNEVVFYTKGAPEKIRSLCLEESIPENYDKVLDSFTVKGYRVLALGSRPLSMKWHQIQRIPRDQVEKDLIFAGFLVMQNSLKSQTIPVIEELNAAAVRSVMVTGDNMLTALSVARECGIIPATDRVLTVEVEEETEGGRGFSDQRVRFKLAAHHILDEEEEEEEENLTATSNLNLLSNSGRVRRSSADSSSSNFAIDLEDLIPISDTGDKSYHTVIQLQDSRFHFAMTGRVWSYLEEHGSPELLDKIVAKGAVYARMSPENKSQLVERLQGLGYIVGMCGDGANDCSALKMAHVGISLSEAEASVAAPFTSKIPDISCVPNLIREGRCALVTSFGIFKYMALYSLVQFASVLLLYYHKTNLSDTQFLYFDLGITTSIAIVMGRTEPYPRLVPRRPMGSLVSFQNVASIIIQVVVSASVQVVGMLFLLHQPWFTPVSPPNPDTLITLCWETTTIFYISGFQYLILALVFSKGPPFRKPFYTNFYFLLVYFVLMALTLLLTAYPPALLSSFFRLMPFTQETATFRLALLSLPALNFALSLALEQDWLNGWIKRVGKRLVLRKTESKNAYKRILREVENDPSWPPISH